MMAIYLTYSCETVYAVSTALRIQPHFGSSIVLWLASNMHSRHMAIIVVWKPVVYCKQRTSKPQVTPTVPISTYAYWSYVLHTLCVISVRRAKASITKKIVCQNLRGYEMIRMSFNIDCVNSQSSARYGCDYKCINLKHSMGIDIFRIHVKVMPGWVPEELVNVKSTMPSGNKLSPAPVDKDISDALWLP